LLFQEPQAMESSEVLFGPAFWHVLTRLGEAQILLPALATVVIALAWQNETRALAARWLMGVVLATLVTTLSKVAFMGWGIGSAALDFTGFSGHSMYAAAVYPALFAMLVPVRFVRARHMALGLGCGLAVLVALSRIVVNAHSVSEIVGGLALGAAASAAIVGEGKFARAQLNPVLPSLLVLWVALTPFQMPTSRSHALVTRIALALSGHSVPFTREHLGQPTIPPSSAPGT
jgi:hypothetical protein